MPPSPTLQDLEQGGGPQPGVEQPVPGSPLFQQNQAPGNQQPPNLPAAASGARQFDPAVANQPRLAPLPAPNPPRPTNTTPPAPNPAVRSYRHHKDPAVTSGGTSGYQTLTTPGGGTAIVVPNGNGTSTIIHSDGRIETVPTTR